MLSSTYTVDAHAQADGSHYVLEHHTDVANRVHQVGPWLAAPGTVDADIAAVVTARAAQIDAFLADTEAAALLEQG